MIGGIYCEIPLGAFYDKSIVNSIRWRLNKLVGTKTKELSTDTIDLLIYKTLDKIVREYYTQRRAKGYNDKSGLLKASYGYSIYEDGERAGETIWNPAAPFAEGSSYLDEFVETYEPITKRGWMVLICVSTPYAARVESTGSYGGKFPGFGKKVLINLTAGLAQKIRAACGRKGTKLEYGYILNSATMNTVGQRVSIK